MRDSLDSCTGDSTPDIYYPGAEELGNMSSRANSFMCYQNGETEEVASLGSREMGLGGGWKLITSLSFAVFLLVLSN